MKSIVIFLPLFLLFSTGFAQGLVTDPALTGVTVLGGIQQNNRLEDMKKHQSHIQQYQLLAVQQLKFVNTWHEKMYKGLSEVSAVVKDSKNILEAKRIVEGILKYQRKVVEYARQDPLLMVFAAQTETHFKSRALDLILYIQTVALKGGKDMLMNAGERASLINYVLTELRVIRALAYSAQRQMYWARMDGILRSLNPYKSFINQDKKIAQDILKTYRF